MTGRNGSTAAAQVVHYCPIYQADVGKEQCQNQSTVIGQNMEFCCAKDCRSPWRFCIACLRQGYKERDNRVTHVQKGLCDFHDGNGSHAVHPRNGGFQEKTTAAEDHYRVVGEVIEAKCGRVKPFKDQPRTYFNPVALKSLETSIKVRGQIQPALVKKLAGDPKHDFELIEGQRRWHACAALGIPLRVEVRKVADANDHFEQSLIANACREDYTPLEKARGVDQLLNNGRTWAYTAECFGRSVGHVQSYRRLLKLHPTIQARLEYTLPEEKRMSLSIAFSLADLPVEEQLSALKKIDEEGLNVNQARELIRKHGEGIGVHVGGERTPKANFQILQNYLRKVSEDSNRFLNMSKDEIVALFKFRDSGDLPVTISQVENAIRQLSSIKSVLSKIGR